MKKWNNLHNIRENPRNKVLFANFRLNFTYKIAIPLSANGQNLDNFKTRDFTL